MLIGYIDEWDYFNDMALKQRIINREKEKQQLYEHVMKKNSSKFETVTCTLCKKQFKHYYFLNIDYITFCPHCDNIKVLQF